MTVLDSAAVLLPIPVGLSSPNLETMLRGRIMQLMFLDGHNLLRKLHPEHVGCLIDANSGRDWDGCSFR